MLWSDPRYGSPSRLRLDCLCQQCEYTIFRHDSVNYLQTLYCRRYYWCWNCDTWRPWRSLGLDGCCKSIRSLGHRPRCRRGLWCHRFPHHQVRRPEAEESAASRILRYGYNIIGNLGNRLTLHSPRRGFSVEFGSAITVILATRLALPISTTQCNTGATVGMGLCSGTWRAISWHMLIWIYAGWIITLPVAGRHCWVFDRDHHQRTDMEWCCLHLSGATQICSPLPKVTFIFS